MKRNLILDIYLTYITKLKFGNNSLVINVLKEKIKTTKQRIKYQNTHFKLRIQ